MQRWPFSCCPLVRGISSACWSRIPRDEERCCLACLASGIPRLPPPTRATSPLHPRRHLPRRLHRAPNAPPESILYIYKKRATRTFSSSSSLFHCVHRDNESIAQTPRGFVVGSFGSDAPRRDAFAYDVTVNTTPDTPAYELCSLCQPHLFSLC